MKTHQELLRARSAHLAAISALSIKRAAFGYELAVQRAQARSNRDAVDQHRAAIAELDGELERRRRKGPTT